MNRDPDNSRVVNKFFAELSAILSEKYGYDITMQAVPKPKEGKEHEPEKQEIA